MITVQRTLSNEAMKILDQLYSARRDKVTIRTVVSCEIPQDFDPRKNPHILTTKVPGFWKKKKKTQIVTSIFWDFSKTPYFWRQKYGFSEKKKKKKPKYRRSTGMCGPDWAPFRLLRFTNDPFFIWKLV